MASLKGRFKEEVKQRVDLLADTSPLSVALGLALSIDPDDSGVILDSASPLHPQLECDFYFNITKNVRGFGDTKRSDSRVQLDTVQLDDTQFILTEFNGSPSELDWEYITQFNFPSPIVKSNKATLIALQASALYESNNVPYKGGTKVPPRKSGVNRLLQLYESQFNENGLLRIPGDTEFDLTVGLYIQSRNKNRELDERRQPLFSLYGVKFGSPKYKLNPSGDSVMGIQMDFSYRSSNYIDFTNPFSLKEPVFEGFEEGQDQFTNRKSK